MRRLDIYISFSIIFALTVVLTQSAPAQTFTVLHTFSGGQDGSKPVAGLTMDRSGNLYGTASSGGANGNGTVYQIKRNGAGWLFSPLYSFTGGSDGASPQARVIIGPNGTLYGTTFGGGDPSCGVSGCGTVFNLRPPPGVCRTAPCRWKESVLHAFTGTPDDGAFPEYGDLTFDQAGKIYGTTTAGDMQGAGTVYELTPSGSGWTEKVIYPFTYAGQDGKYPYAGVTFDNAGNLYGTRYVGGHFASQCNSFGSNGCGTVFELTPSGSGWTENVIYDFQGGGGDGFSPIAGLILDRSGNLYGASSNGSSEYGGTAFELSPSNSGWIFSPLYSFIGSFFGACGPYANLVMDAAGNLYGTTYCSGGAGLGTVFKLTPSGPSWIYTSLHDFTGGNDGIFPISNVTLDASGNLYGTASGGLGCSGACGVVWEITP
jgi:uncharacterized repeat protein (TIGR03803 family)